MRSSSPSTAKIAAVRGPGTLRPGRPRSAGTGAPGTNRVKVTLATSAAARFGGSPAGGAGEETGSTEAADGDPRLCSPRGDTVLPCAASPQSDRIIAAKIGRAHV